MHISSLQNEKVKLARKLRDRKKRDETNLFLIEGYSELLKAFKHKQKIISLFYCAELFLKNKNNERKLIEGIKNLDADLFSCSSAVFQKIAYRDRPDGLLAIAEQKRCSLEDLKKDVLKGDKNKSPFFVVAEHIEKPGNLGTILRSTDGVGADGVIIADPCTDIFNPNVVRASIGSLFTQKVAVASTEETIKFLKENNIKIVATTPHVDTLYHNVDLTQPIAIVVGTEQYGLSEKWLDAADIKVSIPMKGEADSLNVGAATTIMLYETLRQRSERQQ